MPALYKPLETVAEDPEYCSCRESQTAGLLKRIWRLSAANLVLLIIQVILFTTYLTGNWSNAETTSIVQATYGFDTNYMSIDFNYDWVWEEDAIEKAGTIVVDRDDTGVVTEYGTISMYATNSNSP